MRDDVAKHGWPTISRVGKAASGDAWLLVQHADDDPVFQYDMLKLMTPAAMHGDVSKRNFALLSDRVTLKTTGRQRYGTQFTCGDGRHIPRPLEDERRVAEWRASMGLDTLAEYAARIDGMTSPCPPAVIPPSPTKR